MAQTSSKTKKKFIEVARNLFAKNGVENTTMNDIAEASGFGRRTLYTYFKSKSDIYKAIIESELEMMYKELEEVIRRKISADEKLLLFAFSRSNVIKNVVARNGNLRADFFRDIWQVENVRKEFDKKEIHYLETILRDGEKTGIFSINKISQTAVILHYALKGLEVPVIRGVLNLDYEKSADREIVSQLILNGLRKK